MRNKQNNSLADDLNRVLEYEVKFSGAFAVSMVFPGCPNPGLDVDGVGPVAMPLTDETSKLIASVGHQAPYGRGTDTIVDTTVRDTIQIDASNIRFMNPKWAPAIQKWVEEKIWTELGCAPFTSPPKCELYKLLLYKPGAHFLPHQDTEKAPGMFATLVIVLPSGFTGGKVHVSHGGKSIVFDNAEDSAFETTTLAWYTDVTHEVKKITSGYRLALSYHLINTSPGIIPPHLPKHDSSLQHLRGIFSRWSNNEYPSSLRNQAVGYVFDHEYTSPSLRELIFKGSDGHIASILTHACGAEGVLVLMGWLSACIKGCTADHGWQVYEGHGESPEYGGSDGTQYDPVMSRVYKAEFWVDDILDMQGREAGVSRIRLQNHSILPHRVFSGASPDKSELGEGFWGNEGANLEFTYQRAALVMFPYNKQLSVILSTEGSTWALQELEKSESEGPTKENREIIGFLAKKENDDFKATVLKYAFEWNDPSVWDLIVESDPRFFLCGKGYRNLCDGWQAFGLDSVRLTFEKLFQFHDGLERASMQFLLFVKGELPFGTDPQKDEWISTQATRVMEKFTPEKGGDIIKTCVADIVRWRGLYFAASVVLPRFLGERVVFEPVADFAKELIAHREELIALPEAEDQAVGNAELLDQILDEILAATTPLVLTRDVSYHQSMASLLSISISGHRTKSYGDLLKFISRPHQKPFYSRYLDLYEKIIHDLVKLLKEHDIGVSTSPSREFFHYVIGNYLGEILGSREGSPYLKLPMLTCGHEACSRVNDLLRSDETCILIENEEEARTVKRCARDLKIDDRYDLLNCWYRGYWESPLEVNKRHEAQAAQDWNVRLADTRKLLDTIGTDEEISQIMGERYSDVEKALEGSQAFVTMGTEEALETEDRMVGLIEESQGRETEDETDGEDDMDGVE